MRRGGEARGRRKGKRRRGEGREAIQSQLAKWKFAGWSLHSMNIDAAISCHHLSVNLKYCSRKALARGLVPFPVPELHLSLAKSISLPWQPIHKDREGEGQSFVFPAGCSCPSHAGFVTPWHFAKRYCLMMPDGRITRGGCSSGWGCLIVLAPIQMQAPSS